jgi:hypothetical protein
MSFHVPEENRIKDGALASSKKNGNNGAFRVRGMFVIASDGGGWEHISVSTFGYTPTWDDMCKIKRIFWDAEDLVVQYHPRESEYVNNHPHCLHLWRPINKTLPEPPSIMVGINVKSVYKK